MDKWQALNSFWNQFDWLFFDENSVPEEIWDNGTQSMQKLEPPYGTYESAVGRLDDSILLSASLWDNSVSWERISKKADEIKEYIDSQYPKAIPIDGGRMWITSSRPFAQRLSAGRSDWKRIRLSINVEFFTEY